LPQAASRDRVPGRSYHASTGVGTGTRAACGKRFAATRSWRFRRLKLSATTELDTKHKASFNH
jgi:hypothetical protein